MRSVADLLPELVVHGGGLDGFCCAWLHHRHSPRMGEYVAARYGDDPPDVKGREVLIFDFSYSRNTLAGMHEEAESLHVWAPHETAEAELGGLDFCTFTGTTGDAGEREKSGPRMILEHLEGEGAESWVVDYLEGADYWGTAVAEAELFRVGLSSYPRDFETWDRIFKKGEAAIRRGGDPGAALIRQARHIVRYRQRLVEKAVENHGWANIGGHVVPCVNSTVASLAGEIVGRLAEIDGVPFAAGVVIQRDGQFLYRLRSGGGFDVSELAREFGGDGHAGTAYVRVRNAFPAAERL